MAGTETGQIAPRMILARRERMMKPPSLEFPGHLFNDQVKRVTAANKEMGPYIVNAMARSRSVSFAIFLS